MDASKRVEPAVSSQTLQQRANPDRSLATTIYVPEQGGYQEKFLKHVEEKYKCEKCRLVLCNPRQTECGHRFCETCMNSLLRVIEGQAEKLKDLDKEIHSLRQTGEDADNIKSILESLQARLTQLETLSKTAAAWNPAFCSFRLQATKRSGVLETQINRHDQMLSVHDIRLADMDLRFQVLETASYNGVLIWKIRDYKRRKQEAVMGKTLSLYSQPFYTGYFGYKMCARVYLNGDGMGKNTHLSLFFVIMRGEYDSLLPWPFKQKVSLMLMDQGPSRRHLGDAFKPDPNSSSFKKPTGEMNIASGCPVFVAQTVLENGTYIKDDTIFIKVIVDTSDLPDP
ncbi:hypothetical protein AB205_0124550, partial [Aquarana catesbeiana]